MNISKIIEELKRERASIDEAIAALQAVDRTQTSGSVRAHGANGRRKRRLTPEGRKRLSEMMKKRWAERKRKAKPA